MRRRLLISYLSIMAAASSQALAGPWQKALEQYRVQYEEVKKNYGPNIIATHAATVNAHFSVARLEAIATYLFLSRYLQRELMGLQLALLNFEKLQGTNDKASLFLSVNLGRIQMESARLHSERAKLAFSELKKLIGNFNHFCSKEYLSYTESYFNPQTLFAPRYISVDRSPGLDANWQVNISVGYTYNEGGHQSFGSTTPGFQVGSKIPATWDNAGRTTCAAVGSAAGLCCCQGLPVCGFVGSVLGAATWELGKLAYSYFTDYLDELDAFSDIQKLTAQMNQIMKDTTPTKADSDAVIAKTCRAKFFENEKDEKNKVQLLLEEDWKKLAEILNSSFASLAEALNGFEILEARNVDALLKLGEKNRDFFLAEDFSRISADAAVKTLEDYRAWLGRTRLVSSQIRSIEMTEQPLDLFDQLERETTLDELMLKGSLLLVPNEKSPYMTAAATQGRPLHGDVHRLESRALVPLLKATKILEIRKAVQQ